MASDIEQRRLIQDGARVLAAVSGGADSVALLLVLLRLAPPHGWQVSAAHFNHRMRGGADGDQEFVEQLCAGLEVKLQAGAPETDVRLLSEQDAREARWAFLREAARSACADVVATGHTLDDRAETALLNLVRGSGVDGLAAMGWRSGDIVRPLLGRGRAEVRAFLSETGADWREDETNENPAFARNRLRMHLLPIIEEFLNSRASAALARLSETAAADSDHLNEEAVRFLTESRLPDLLEEWGIRGQAVSIDAARLTEAHLAIARRAIRIALSELKGDGLDLGLEMVDRLLVAARDGSYEASAGHGMQFGCRGGVLRIWKPLPPPEPFRNSMEAGGQVSCGYFLAGVSVEPPNAKWTLAAPVPGEVIVRSWRPGDRMRPVGLGGSKKLQDIFVDAKVPREIRARLPLFCLDGEIVWVPGVVTGQAIAGNQGRWLWADTAQGRGARDEG